MVYILNEGGNSVLIKKNAKAPLTPDIRKYLKSIMDNFSGDKGSRGFTRLCDILAMDNDEGGVKYNELTQLKHNFDKILPNSEEFQILGGAPMKWWVESSLNGLVGLEKARKMALKNAGIDNVFRRTHEKNRGTKSKQKPSIAKFQVKQFGKNIQNGTPLKMVAEGKTIVISEDQTNYIKEIIKK